MATDSGPLAERQASLVEASRKKEIVMSELILGVGQAHKLEHALRRNGWKNAEEIDTLSKGDLLSKVRQVVLGRAEIVPIKPRLLELVTTVEVAGAKRFVAADHFVVGKDGITGLGEDFKKVFLGKVETDVQPATIQIHRLTESSLDATIRAELGADREEIALAHFWAVYAFRYGDGWHVRAYSVTYPLWWPAGRRVFSR